MSHRVYCLAGLLFLLASFLLTGCRQTLTTSNSATLTISLDTNAPFRVGRDELHFTVKDAAGSFVNDATLAVRADMNHAGMVPILAQTTTGKDGVYTAPLTWTMGGEWILTVTVTRPDGRRMEQQFTVMVNDN